MEKKTPTRELKLGLRVYVRGLEERGTIKIKSINPLGPTYFGEDTRGVEHKFRASDVISRPAFGG